MFNNVVLDVFIGLVLVYLLYSLLMTIVSEMLATWMNLRPRILRTSIEKMLNDGYFPVKPRPSIRHWLGLPWLWSWVLDFWRIFQSFFLKEFKDFKHSFAARFYDAPSIKYLTSKAGEPRTFFTQTKPSYISADNFADSLFRLLREGGSGSTDMEKVHFALRFNSQLIQTGSLKQLRDLAESAGTSDRLFRDKLKAWYNETQDRATGWYKRKIQLLLFWLGFTAAAIFNVDSIRIAKILAKDKDARDKLVTMGIAMAKDSVRYKDFIISNGDSLHPKQVMDSSYARINKDIKEANLVLGLGWETDKLKGYSQSQKFWWVIGKVFGSWSFWGFVITGLMISLGAPFWFDLLKRLVAIRGSGVKPEEKKPPLQTTDLTSNTQPQHSQTAPPSASADKVALVLESLTHKTRDEAGIVAIAIEYKADSSPVLMIVADSDQSKAFLEKKYSTEEKLYDGFAVPIEYSTDIEITVHLAKAGSEIANQTQALGAGTLGCHMKKKGTDDLYFISCWHVLKDNSKWDEAPVNSTIICKDAILGRIEKGFLSHHPHMGIDIAIAKYNNVNDAEPNPDFIITSQHRAVTARDFVLRTKVKLMGKVSGLKEARIFHNRLNARVKYPDGKTYLMNDVFSITAEDAQGNKTAPTTQGDSGAVVLDDKGTPLGVIIGGSGVFSYAVKFSNLFDDDKPLKEFFFNI